MVVNNRMAFFSDALGHSALTGIAIGVILGIASPQWAMIIFALIFSIGISVFKNVSRASTDTTIGVFSSMAIALGIVILSKGGGFNKYSVYLIGDLLSISPLDLVMLAVALLIVIIFWSTAFNKLMMVSINQPLAHSRGINTRLFEILFTSVVAIIVTFSIQWVGLMIINSLLVLPAAASRNVT
jgi:zinc transport system permease protein